MGLCSWIYYEIEKKKKADFWSVFSQIKFKNVSNSGSCQERVVCVCVCETLLVSVSVSAAVWFICVFVMCVSV